MIPSYYQSDPLARAICKFDIESYQECRDKWERKEELTREQVDSLYKRVSSYKEIREEHFRETGNSLRGRLHPLAKDAYNFDDWHRLNAKFHVYIARRTNNDMDKLSVHASKLDEDVIKLRKEIGTLSSHIDKVEKALSDGSPLPKPLPQKRKKRQRRPSEDGSKNEIARPAKRYRVRESSTSSSSKNAWVESFVKELTKCDIAHCKNALELLGQVQNLEQLNNFFAFWKRNEQFRQSKIDEYLTEDHHIDIKKNLGKSFHQIRLQVQKKVQLVQKQLSLSQQRAERARPLSLADLIAQCQRISTFRDLDEALELSQPKTSAIMKTLWRVLANFKIHKSTTMFVKLGSNLDKEIPSNILASLKRELSVFPKLSQ